jgi:hypothetical protein
LLPGCDELHVGIINDGIGRKSWTPKPSGYKTLLVEAALESRR